MGNVENAAGIPVLGLVSTLFDCFFSDRRSILLALIMSGWECEVCTKYTMKL